MWSSSSKRGGGARFGPGHRTISNDEFGPVPNQLSSALSSDFTPPLAENSEPPLTSSCRICRSVLDRLERVERDRDQIKASLIRKEKELLKAGVARLDPNPPAHTQDDSMKAAGKQIAEANARHRTLAAEMEKESLRWRNDMDMKVAKYALMCKELSEDNARGKEALRFSKEEIARLEIERNGLAKLNQKLLVGKAEGAPGAENGSPYSPLQNTDPPSPSNQARVTELEGVVEKLASRLEQAMSIIEKLQEERKLLVRNQVGGGGGDRERAGGGDAGGHSAMLVKTLSAQLSSERTTCKNALLQVSKARTESLAREGDLLKHIKLLEEELKRSLQSRQDRAQLIQSTI
ncbi:hypothetical protein TrST_g112 [Triparma strigata]|uniref:Uncharacterized protein n=1 Tax=Triparma strigata TaxID=1606541 RepID=A0A9W7A9Z4_9STRA|nr:hypothetical protein TrST_g112 [Triparma strigata]